jgi:hydrogenase small subunit
MAYPAVHPEHGVVGRSAVAVGAGAAVLGAIVGAGIATTRKLTRDAEREGGEE